MLCRETRSEEAMSPDVTMFGSSFPRIDDTNSIVLPPFIIPVKNGTVAPNELVLVQVSCYLEAVASHTEVPRKLKLGKIIYTLVNS